MGIWIYINQDEDTINVKFSPFKIVKRTFRKKARGYTLYSYGVVRTARINDDWRVEEGYVFDSKLQYNNGKFDKYHKPSIYHYFYLIRKRTDIFGFQRSFYLPFLFYARDDDAHNLIGIYPPTIPEEIKDLKTAIKVFEEHTNIHIENSEYEYEDDKAKKIVERIIENWKLEYMADALEGM